MKKAAGYVILVVCVLLIAAGIGPLAMGASPDVGRIVVIAVCIVGVFVGLSWARGKPPTTGQ
jgi:hypothetical protein